MPGVSVITDTWAGPASTPSPAHAAYFVTGLADRGPVGETRKVSSLNEFEAFYGPRVPYGTLHDDLRMFFAEGGGEAHVSRIVGDTPTTGFLILKDKSTGAGLDTLRVEAASPGAWSSALSVAVVAGTAPDTFKLTVSYQGAVVGTYDNLATPVDAVIASQDSVWVKVTNLGSLSAGVTAQPKNATAALSPGTDDRGTVDAASVELALAAFGEDLGSGAVAAPGLGATVAGAALIAHAKAFDRIALLAGGFDDTIADAIAGAADFVAAGNEVAGYFYPWQLIPDGATTKPVSPEGFVAAKRATAVRNSGPWKVPAGEAGIARFVLGPVTALTRAEGDELDGNRVSVIRTVAGTTRLYGWRSLSTDTLNYPLLSARDLLNYIAIECSKVVEQYVFETIDSSGQLLSKVGASLVGVLDPIRAAGGLFERIDKVSGQRLDPGYSVNVGPEINTDETASQNKILAEVRVRNSPNGSDLVITIVKASLAASL